MVWAFVAFTDFCYVARRSVIMETDLQKLDEHLELFHRYRRIFQTTGVRAEDGRGFSLPRQHSMVHYRQHIENFGAPNGLCSSITESKHIVAVKKPWRRSSRFHALSQMLETNLRLDKLHTLRVDFELRKMLPTTSHFMPSLPAAAADECGALDSPVSIMGEVQLAHTRGM
jgi:hypothetical protein